MSPIALSKRACLTPPSPIRRLAYLARAAKARGIKVHHLNIGQPDLPTPREFLEGVRDYDTTVLAYETSEGNERLRDLWCERMNQDLSLDLDPSAFLITTGASEALIFTFMICCDPGDEILILDPTYANYFGFAAISGVNLVPIDTRLSDGFNFPDISQITRKISSKTKAILICNPNNPTGTVYSDSSLLSLLNICQEQNIFLVVDEAYREFVYDGLSPRSILQLTNDRDRVIVIDSLSKRYSLCGARIGTLISTNTELQAKALNLAQARLASATIEQIAAVNLLRNVRPDYLIAARKEYELRRDTLFDGLALIKGVAGLKPQGAFYAVVELPVDDAEDFAKFMLSNFSDSSETVFLAPANGFYSSPGRGINQVRIAYVINCEELRRACKLIDMGLEAYKLRALY